MLSGFFLNHLDKDQLLKEMHNNNIEDFTHLSSSAKEVKHHRGMWKALCELYRKVQGGHCLSRTTFRTITRTRAMPHSSKSFHEGSFQEIVL